MLPVALVFTVDAIAAIASQVHRFETVETGGLLFGPAGVGPSVVLRAVATANVAVNQDREFAIDPDQQGQQVSAWADAGCELVGTYHSHPNGNGAMSEADAAMAEQTGKLLIVAPGEPWEWRLYDPLARGEVGFKIAPPGQYSQRSS